MSLKWKDKDGNLNDIAGIGGVSRNEFKALQNSMKSSYLLFTPVIAGMTFTPRDNRETAHRVYRTGNLMVANLVGSFSGNCTATNWYGMVLGYDDLLEEGEKVDWGYGNPGITGSGFTDVLGGAIYVSAGQTSVSVSGQLIGVIYED